MNKLKGTGVAMVTPFDKTGAVDYPALATLTDFLVKDKVDYLVVLGTTGETATLNAEEKKRVVEHVLKTNAGRVPVVLGLAGNNTAELIESAKKTDFTGISAILSASPHYNKPNQEGIYLHYKALSEHSPLPVILYN